MSTAASTQVLAELHKFLAGAELQDVDGVAMSAEAAQTFVATLP